MTFLFCMFVYFQNGKCGVYVCDSTLENGKTIENVFLNHLEDVVFPQLTRQKVCH
jgi:hypothetical protein